jgi:drug/metabolite transporter (DMT)-like permease
MRDTTAGRGYLIALTGVVVWSWTGILISYLLRRHPIAPMTLAFWRDAATAGTLLVALAALRRSALRIARHDRAFLLVYGAALTIMNVTWTWSVAWNGAAVSTVLVYSSVGITGLAARFVFGERLDVVRVLAFAGAVAGCVLVSKATDVGGWNLNAPGVVAGVSSAVSFAWFSLMGKAASRRGIDPWTATLCTFGVAAAALLPIASFSMPGAGASASFFSLGARWDGWLLVLLLVVPTLGGYGLYTASLAYLPAGTANLIATLEPVLTTIWAYSLLGESLDGMQLVGGSLILVSVVSLQLEERLVRAARAGEPVAANDEAPSEDGDAHRDDRPWSRSVIP